MPMKTIPYKELLENHSNVKEDITYSDLLNTNEWKKFRDEIEDRDNHLCVHCGIKAETAETLLTQDEVIANREEITFSHFILLENKLIVETRLADEGYHYRPIIKLLTPISKYKHVWLEIHHSYYIKNHLPWEYDAKVLKSLCRDCHQKEHENLELIEYNDVTRTEFTLLKTCSKCIGTGHLPQYDYFKNGLCFECYGAGYLNL